MFIVAQIICGKLYHICSNFLSYSSAIFLIMIQDYDAKTLSNLNNIKNCTPFCSNLQLFLYVLFKLFNEFVIILNKFLNEQIFCHALEIMKNAK